jgi:hypothetical protein
MGHRSFCYMDFILPAATFACVLGASNIASADDPPPPAGFDTTPAQTVAPTPPPAPVARPEVMTYQPDGVPPPGYHEDSKADTGFIVAGAVVFGSSYILTSLSAVVAGAVAEGLPGGNTGGDYAPMYIPVAGPFVTMGSAHASGLGIVTLALLGAAQAGGVALFVTGFAKPEKRYLRDDVAKPKVTVLPVVGTSSVGLGLVGTL